MQFDNSIPIDDIVPPERSDKLHPYEDEDQESWEEFRTSIGTEPNKPLEVMDCGDHYEIIDGDRRFRALRENEAETVPCFIRQQGEEIQNESDRLIKMVTANEFRKPSNKEQRARHIAQLVAPWLLSSGERSDDTELMTQSDFSSEIGKSQGTISIWLQPVRDTNPLRAALSEKASGRRPDEDDIEQIDNIVDLLKRGGDDGNLVISIGQEQFVASELDDMEGVSLSELETVAEKAVDEGWNSPRFLEYVNENYAFDDMDIVEENVDAGMMDGSTDPFEDNDFTDSEGISVDDVDVETEDEEVDFSVPNIDVDWSDHISDSDLNGTSLSELKTRRMMSQTIQDEAAVAMNVLSTTTGLSHREVMKQFVEPLIVDQTIAHLSADE